MLELRQLPSLSPLTDQSLRSKLHRRLGMIVRRLAPWAHNCRRRAAVVQGLASVPATDVSVSRPIQRSLGNLAAAILAIFTVPIASELATAQQPTQPAPKIPPPIANDANDDAQLKIAAELKIAARHSPKQGDAATARKHLESLVWKSLSIRADRMQHLPAPGAAAPRS